MSTNLTIEINFHLKKKKSQKGLDLVCMENAVLHNIFFQNHRYWICNFFSNWYNGTSTYESPHSTKNQYTKRASKKFPSHLIKHIQNTKTKIVSAFRLRSSPNSFRSITWTLCCALIIFNIYVNDYVVINEHIPSGGYNIYTLYDCFWGLERITPFIG